jgi:uncharacterized membrane protein YqjE
MNADHLSLGLLALAITLLIFDNLLVMILLAFIILMFWLDYRRYQPSR